MKMSQIKQYIPKEYLHIEEWIKQIYIYGETYK